VACRRLCAVLEAPAVVASLDDVAVVGPIKETPGSVFQIEGLLAGDFDIAMTPFDNVVAYQEDQGEVHFDTPPDLFVFMRGISSTLRLIVRPEISSFADLKDRVLGVDALTTGYTLLMYRLLDHNGLPKGSYRLERLDGRWRAGTLYGQPANDLAAKDPAWISSSGPAGSVKNRMRMA
jgi:TRAP-type uncharacterized transport system substrate-binding protein